MPLDTVHTLTAREAHDIKQALLAAAADNACGVPVEMLAEWLIAAFRRVDEVERESCHGWQGLPPIGRVVDPADPAAVLARAAGRDGQALRCCSERA